jgi:hypothetical protein
MPVNSHATDTAAPAVSRFRRRLASLVTATGMVLSMGATALVSPTAAHAATVLPQAPEYTWVTVVQPAKGTSATLNWYPAYDYNGTQGPITGYQVRRSGGVPYRDAGWTSGVLAPQTSDGTHQKFLFTYLKPNTTYDFYVRSINSIGKSPEAKITFKTASVPGAVTGLKTTLLKGGATLAWRAQVDCSYEYYDYYCSENYSDGGSTLLSYRVSRDGTDINGIGAWSGDVTPSTLSKTFTYLKPGATYNLSVAAVNTLGVGPKTTVKVIIPTVPNAPAIGTAVAGVSGGAINAKAYWSKPTNVGGTPTSYTVYAYRVVSGTNVETLIASNLSPSYVSYTFPLTRTGNWRFRVKAKNAAGTSAYSAYSNIVAGR